MQPSEEGSSKRSEFGLRQTFLQQMFVLLSSKGFRELLPYILPLKTPCLARSVLAQQCAGNGILSCFTHAPPKRAEKIKTPTLNWQKLEPHRALKNHAKEVISKVSLSPFSPQTHSLVRDSLTDDIWAKILPSAIISKWKYVKKIHLDSFSAGTRRAG